MSAALAPGTLRVIARVAAESGRRVRLTMRGRSMLPLLRQPMVLEVAPLTSRANLGDVILFERAEIVVAHRVVGYNAEHYVTNGDAQPLITEHVAPADVLGRLECVWSDGSVSARRVDTRTHRLRGLWYARSHPLRARTAVARTRARNALRRMICLTRRGPTTT